LAFPLLTATTYSSQYFTSRSGRLLKWKQLPNHRMEVRTLRIIKVGYVTHIMQCIDGKDVLAVYEAGQASRDYSALLTIRHAGLAVVTEILTTLMLSQMAIVMQWQN
jgi:hypothetical protein